MRMKKKKHNTQDLQLFGFMLRFQLSYAWYKKDYKYSGVSSVRPESK